MMLSLLVTEPLSPALQTPPSRFVNFLIFCCFCTEWFNGCSLADWAAHWLIACLFFPFWVIYQAWNCLSDGTCTKTLRQHSDYVICLAAAEKNVISISIFSWILLTAWMKSSCLCILLSKLNSIFSKNMLESMVYDLNIIGVIFWTCFSVMHFRAM